MLKGVGSPLACPCIRPDIRSENALGRVKTSHSLARSRPLGRIRSEDTVRSRLSLLIAGLAGIALNDEEPECAADYLEPEGAWNECRTCRER